MQMADVNQRAEEIITKWLEFNNLWLNDENQRYQSNIEPMGRDYILDFRAFQHFLDPDDVVDEDTDEAVVFVHIAVNDELGHAILMGVFEDDLLKYCAHEIDTDWRDFWAFSGGFLNKP
jgi:hypothetical protein